MTLASFFAAYARPLTYAMLAAPWVAYALCWLIPGRREEPWILGANLWLSLLSLIALAIYVVYVHESGGWQGLVERADLWFLFLPPYHFLTSLWLSKMRLPLREISTIRIFQGLGLMAVIFLLMSWLASRVYLVFFSYLPFHVFLLVIAGLAGLAYWVFRRFIAAPAS